MQPCMYSPRSVIIPQWIKQLVYATRNALREWLQLARLAAKNNDSRSGMLYFDTAVRHIFEGLSKSFAKIFCPLIEKIF